ncbi:MAG: T9SS type A sorting domain-containing protein [Bacteroidia bacterium]|nr:T9SS type A sorting domain-containing protein [Bacteroidia bacterium]
MKKIKIVIYLVLVLFVLPSKMYAQTAPFKVYLEPLNIEDLGGLQAYAFGQYNGKWIVFGGRLDGLHRRQPFASFDVAGNNNQIWVIDPITRQKWSASLSSLSISLQEQLSSTNMQFHQEGNTLYIIGGYGYNAQSASRKTFDNLTAIDIPLTINAIIGGTNFVQNFRQISNSQFAVTGGHLKKINNTYYLLGGNKFDGNYNPMGNPTYTQVYTNAVRKFIINDDGTNLNITHLVAYTDAINLHRRDYNAVPQILPNGAEGVTMFSGVFQPTINLPFLNSVNIDSINHTVNSNFQQYYNHYHCAVLPIYSAEKNEMHSIFFGGIAQYYDSAGTLVQDNKVPFVKTIARVTRSGNGDMAEYKLPIEMPNYLGAGAEFIANNQVKHYTNEVIKLDELTGDSTLVGYIFGGINSTAPNVFETNTGTQSSASNLIFKVYVIKNNTTGEDNINRQSISSLKMQVFPNPNDGEFYIKYQLSKSSKVKITIINMEGKIIDSVKFDHVKSGENFYNPQLNNHEKEGTYMVTIETNEEKVTQKVIIKR